MIVAHDDLDFLADLQGELRDYVVDELNVRELEVCDDPLKYATIKAEPNFAVLGKRLGKAMGAVGKGVKSMTEADIVAFQKSGVFAVGDNVLGADDIVVKRGSGFLLGSRKRKWMQRQEKKTSWSLWNLPRTNL